MKYLLIIGCLIGITAQAQTISPAPVAGSQTIVTINTKTYMVAYPSGIPAGADVRVMLSWNGIGETSGAECTANGWHRNIANGWDMRQRKADGSYIYWIVIGLPYYGTSTTVVNQYYAQPIDALCNYFVGLGILDSTNVDNFNSLGLSIGSRQWYYFANYGSHNGVYRTKFKRVLTMSPVNISSTYVTPYSSTGRYAVFFNTLDPNNCSTCTPPAYAYLNYNNTASSTKRIDSVTVSGCHCNTVWDSAISTKNFDKIPAPGVRTANSSVITWMTDPYAGLILAAPVANAGPDQVIQLPTNTATLSGSATDADGTIASYLWTKVSGGTATIFSPSSASTTVNSLVEGVYIFRLTATDNTGATGTDDVTITVTPAAATGTIRVRGRKIKLN